jgi:hypothetical protein
MTYLGYEVLDLRGSVDVQEQSPLSMQWLVDVSRFDRTHPIERYFRSIFPDHRASLKCQFSLISEFAVLRDFFKERRGSLESFWLVYPFRTFDLTQDLLGGDASIFVRSVGYSDVFLSSYGPFRHVTVSNGSDTDLRKIINAIDGELEDELELDSPLTLPATEKEDAEVLFLFFVKFGSDSLASSWPELMVHSEVQMSFIEQRSYPS